LIKTDFGGYHKVKVTYIFPFKLGSRTSCGIYSRANLLENLDLIPAALAL
jgi:hypothetical protein